MFWRLKRRFYSVLLVIAVLLAVILVSAYLIIEKALVSDYSMKTEDIARKITNDFQIKTDYAEYISLLFIDNLMAKTDNNGEFAEYDFNADVNKIRIYNSDIDGLGLFWDNGNRSLSSSKYLQYVPELKEVIKKENKTCWVIVKERKGEKGYLFLLTPVENEKNLQTGFALVEVTALKKSISEDNLFLKDAYIYFDASGETLDIIGGEKKKSDLVIEQQIQDSLKLVMHFPMSEVKNQLNRVKLYICLFGVVFICLSVFVVYRMVEKIVSELEFLKNEIDGYASEKNKGESKGHDNGIDCR